MDGRKQLDGGRAGSRPRCGSSPRPVRGHPSATEAVLMRRRSRPAERGCCAGQPAAGRLRRSRAPRRRPDTSLRRAAAASCSCGKTPTTGGLSQKQLRSARWWGACRSEWLAGRAQHDDAVTLYRTYVPCCAARVAASPVYWCGVRFFSRSSASGESPRPATNSLSFSASTRRPRVRFLSRS